MVEKETGIRSLGDFNDSIVTEPISHRVSAPEASGLGKRIRLLISWKIDRFQPLKSVSNTLIVIVLLTVDQRGSPNRWYYYCIYLLYVAPLV